MELFKIVSVCVVLVCVIYSCFIKWQPNIYSLSENGKCPFCGGVSLCEIMKEGQINLNYFHFVRNTISLFFSKKPVLVAKWQNKNVVLKMLRNFNQLTRIDCPINQQTLMSSFIGIDTVKDCIKDLLHTRLKNDLLQGIILCPNSHNIDFLIAPILTVENVLDQTLMNNISVNLLHKYINIWTLLQNNAEPIIQKALEGWPVATYLGSCGQIVASEHCGEMLTTYAKTANWSARAKLSQQLLEAVLNLTFNHPNFSFYFMDVSADNIAVSEEGILKFVDVEDVIIVDKNPIEIPPFWNNPHHSEIYEAGVFSFSQEEICSHHISDHNLYAVCQEILCKTSPLISGGLLYAPPQTLEAELRELLDKCLEGTDRFEAAKKLIYLFQNET